MITWGSWLKIKYQKALLVICIIFHQTLQTAINNSHTILTDYKMISYQSEWTCLRYLDYVSSDVFSVTIFWSINSVLPFAIVFIIFHKIVMIIWRLDMGVINSWSIKALDLWTTIAPWNLTNTKYYLSSGLKNSYSGYCRMNSNREEPWFHAEAITESWIQVRWGFTNVVN